MADGADGPPRPTTISKPLKPPRPMSVSRPPKPPLPAGYKQQGGSGATASASPVRVGLSPDPLPDKPGKPITPAKPRNLSVSRPGRPAPARRPPSRAAPALAGQTAEAAETATAETPTAAAADSISAAPADASPRSQRRVTTASEGSPAPSPTPKRKNGDVSVFLALLPSPCTPPSGTVYSWHCA